MNEDTIKTYLYQNWDKIKLSINTKQTSEEYYNFIKESITDINEKLNSGLYILDSNKGIKEKYQTRTYGYEVYKQWWGYQYYLKSQQAANVFRYEIQKLANQTYYYFGWTGYGAWLASNAERVAQAGYNCYQVYGSAKISIYISILLEIIIQ